MVRSSEMTSTEANHAAMLVGQNAGSFSELLTSAAGAEES
jgi:hypothetical protein